MFLRLHDLIVELDGEDPRLRAAWAALFAGWLEPVLPPGRPPDVTLRLAAVEQLPPPPGRSYFSNQSGPDPAPPAVLAGRLPAGRTLLHLTDGAQLTFPPLDGAAGSPVVVSGLVVPRLVTAAGRLEDITYAALAPWLRRRGLYLVHAAATARNGRALLLAGPTGSGKTTTSLRLLTAGWRLLGNDVVLLQRRPDAVYALPTPGGTAVSPATVELLPHLRPLAGRYPADQRTGKHTIPTNELVAGQWAAPAPVGAILFPAVAPQAETRLEPISRSMTLARLLPESVDRWDEAALPVHLALLQDLTAQAAAYDLRLGRVPPDFDPGF